jgi:activator of HSP90 ATPase
MGVHSRARVSQVNFMTDIRQTITFNARPNVIFEALMNSRKHSAFTGAPAKISRKVGGAFTAYRGNLTGVNLDIVKNKSIVQAWRTKIWPKGAWSIVSYMFAAAPGGKTKLSFSHTGIQGGGAKTAQNGWKGFYWNPLKASLKAAAAEPARAKKAAPRHGAASRGRRYNCSA